MEALLTDIRYGIRSLLNRLSMIIFVVCYAALGETAISAQEARPGKVVIEPYVFKTYDGKEYRRAG